MKAEIIASAVAAGSALVAAWISLQSSQNINDLESRLEKSKTEFEQMTVRQMPFLERQLAIYVEATEIASEIANAPQERDTATLETQFWQLYWGSLAIFEEQTVAAAMVEFGKALKQEDRSGLRRLSIQLAHACRDSIQSQWNIQMEEFTDPRPGA